MRVISGTHRGRQLKSVTGNNTRPTTDKVKESIFNMIGPYFDGGLCLDLFAGSGSLGIESLSRGAQKTIFVEKDIKAFQTIKMNLKNLQLEDNSEVYRADAKKALNALCKRELKFDYIFLDPPYERDLLNNIIEKISAVQLLSDNGIVVCEHESNLSLKENIGNLIKVREEQYGLSTVSIFKTGL